MMRYLLILIAIAAPLMLWVAALWCVWTRRRVASAFALATAFHETVLYAFPILHSAFAGNEVTAGLALPISFSELLRVGIGECIYVSLFLAAASIGIRLVCARAHSGQPARAGRLAYNTAAVEKWVCLTLCTLTLVFYTRQIDSGSSTGGLALAFDQVNALFGFAGLVAAANLFVDSRPLRDRKYSAIYGAIVLGIVAYYGLSMANRGRLVWVICAMFVVSWIKGAKKYYAAIAALGCLSLATLAIFGSNDVRNTIRAQLDSGMDRSQIVASLLRSETEGGGRGAPGIAGTVEAAAIRAQGPRNSVSLYAMRDLGDSIGYKTLVGAVLFPVPRVFWGRKPVAGGDSSDESSMAMYRVMTATYGQYFEGTMGPFLASAHGFWEAGWLGLLGGALITGSVWGALLGRNWTTLWLQALVAMAICGSFVIDGFVTTLVPLYAMIAGLWKGAAIYYVVVPLVRQVSAAIESRKRRTVSRGWL